MIQFKIFSRSPFLIFRINQYVYKFFDQKFNSAEYDWLDFVYLFDEFNCKNSPKFLIPCVEIHEYYLKIDYVGASLYSLPNEINTFYHSLRLFSYFYHDQLGFTFSIGDAQLRNVYKSAQGYFLLDLGSKLGSKVSLYYDRSRFLIHLIDSGFFWDSFRLLNKDSDKNMILALMKQRSLYVFFKRLKKLALLSAFYRLFCFQLIYIRLII